MSEERSIEEILRDAAVRRRSDLLMKKENVDKQLAQIGEMVKALPRLEATLKVIEDELEELNSALDG